MCVQYRYTDVCVVVLDGLVFPWVTQIDGVIEQSGSLEFGIKEKFKFKRIC